MSADHLNDIEHVRTRPSMYVGSTHGVFGIIHYLVDATNLVLQHSPKILEFTVTPNGFSIGSDIALPIHENDSGEIFPFESFQKDGKIGMRHGPVVIALSEYFTYAERSRAGELQYSFRNGVRSKLEVQPCPSQFRSQIHFSPDPTIFESPTISKYNLNSYLRRLSFFNPETNFTFNNNGEVRDYHAANGSADMFAGIASPYQLMHEPIRIRITKDELKLEFIYSFHSWTNDVCIAFINDGRAVDGGTHQTGLERAIAHLKSNTFSTGNGVVGLLCLQYPNVQWDGCIKAKIGSPELDSLVFDSIIDGSNKAITEKPELLEQISHIQPFQFPEAWFTGTN